MRNASYESRMIVWSSVVWSSDLAAATRSGLGRRPASLGQGLESRLLLHQRSGEWSPAARRQAGPAASEAASEIPFTLHCNTRANERGTGELNHSPQDRKRVRKGKRVSGSVDLSGSRRVKKTKKKKTMKITK